MEFASYRVSRLVASVLSIGIGDDGIIHLKSWALDYTKFAFTFIIQKLVKTGGRGALTPYSLPSTTLDTGKARRRDAANNIPVERLGVDDVGRRRTRKNEAKKVVDADHPAPLC